LLNYCKKLSSFFVKLKAVYEVKYNKNYSKSNDGEMISVYPSIYDIYKSKRVFIVNPDNKVISQHDLDYHEKLDKSINDLMGTFSSNVNVIVLSIWSTDKNIRYKIERQWLFGKRNNIVILVGMGWIDVFTWGKNYKNDMLVEYLKTNLNDLEDTKEFTNTINYGIINYYKTPNTEDFQYLKDDKKLSSWQLSFLIIISLIVSIITSMIFHRNEIKEGTY
jgi:hypothetical protein